jgi:hypothetical protein
MFDMSTSIGDDNPLAPIQITTTNEHKILSATPL